VIVFITFPVFIVQTVALGFTCGTHRLIVDMCFISFIESCSIVGSSVAEISKATSKWKWQFYSSVIQRQK